METKYHKIESVFKRDMEGTKKLIIGEYRNPIVEYLKDNTWIFTEKVDGTNTRIIWDGYNFEFKGRTDKAELPKPLLDRLNELFSNNETEQLFEQMFGEKVVVIYCEGYGGKIQKGKLYKPNEDLIVFDIMINNVFLERSDVEGICKSLGLDIVPIWKECTLTEGIEFVKTSPKSVISDCTMEGLIGKPKVEMRDKKGERIIVKIKVKDFKHLK